MSSSALFIIVAESIVIFLPIDQVGCLRASAGVAATSDSRGQERKGPPLAVSTIRVTSSGVPDRRA